MSAVPQLVRVRCKTCPRSMPPSELLAGLCPACLVSRVDNFNRFVSELVEENGRKCAECPNRLVDGAYLHWDVTANSFCLLCIPCSEKVIATAGQYRGTEFGYLKKAQ